MTEDRHLLVKNFDLSNCPVDGLRLGCRLKCNSQKAVWEHRQLMRSQ